MKKEEAKLKIKTHVKKHLPKYVAASYVVIGIGVAAGTAVITRRMMERQLSSLNPVLHGGTEPVLHGGTGGPDQALSSPINFAPLNSNFLGNVNLTTVIEANRQGPPSWVIRRREDNAVFLSQNSAASDAGVSPSIMSSHLNGKRDDIDGSHYERICMAAA